MNEDSLTIPQAPETSRSSNQLAAIKILAINTNSLQYNTRRFELHCRIEQHKPDIVLLSEPKLTNKHYIFSQTHKIIRLDRPNSKQGGGTAIMVKNNISHKVIMLRTKK